MTHHHVRQHKTVACNHIELRHHHLAAPLAQMQFPGDGNLEAIANERQRQAEGGRLGRGKSKPLEYRERILDRLEQTDTNSLTPLQALNLLEELKNEIRGRGNA